MGTSPRSYASALRLKSCGPQAETTKQQHGAGAPPLPPPSQEKSTGLRIKRPILGPGTTTHRPCGLGQVTNSCVTRLSQVNAKKKKSSWKLLASLSALNIHSFILQQNLLMVTFQVPDTVPGHKALNQSFHPPSFPRSLSFSGSGKRTWVLFGFNVEAGTNEMIIVFPKRAASPAPERGEAGPRELCKYALNTTD